MILVDYSSIKMRHYFGHFYKKIPQELLDSNDISKLKDSIYENVAEVDTVFNHDFGEPVICGDSKPYWRNDVFPAYKILRNKLSEVESTNMALANEAAMEVFGNLPYKTMLVDKCEADDIIMTLAADTKEKTLIYSVDKDFIQMQYINPLIQQFSWRHKKYLTKEHFDIDLHILMGDQADGVPCVWCNLELTEESRKFFDDRGIFESGREIRSMNLPAEIIKEAPSVLYKSSGIGPAKAKKLSANLDEVLKDPIINENYELNKTLVTYEGIPQDIKDNILNTYRSAKVDKTKVQNITNHHKNLIFGF